MKTTSYLTFLYGGAVLLSGIMGYPLLEIWESFLEILFSSLLIISAFFMIMEKKAALYTALGSVSMLALLYGYRFAVEQRFSSGILTAMGAFLVILHIIKIFHLSSL